MKTVAPPILRRFGFRTVLLVNGVITALSFAVYAVFTPSMPHWQIMAVLVGSSFFRSLQFTALGSLAFADIDQVQMSRASTTSAVCQQVVQSLGVGLAATLLHFLQQARGESHLTWQAVSPAFVAVGLVSMISMLWFVRMPRNAGDEMNGRSAT
jgi:hypothetical protein